MCSSHISSAKDGTMANYDKKVCRRFSARCRMCKAHKVVGNSERVEGRKRPNRRKTSHRHDGLAETD